MAKVFKNKIGTAICAMYFATQFVPYSVSGPAMSCSVANGNFVLKKSAILQFMSSRSANFGDVTDFLIRSDFKIRNAQFAKPEKKTTGTDDSYYFQAVFQIDDTNTSCAVFGVLRMMPESSTKLIIVDVSTLATGDPQKNAIVTSITNNNGE